MAKVKKNVLGINYLNGWMRAFRSVKFGKEEGWSADERVDHISDIGGLLKEAVEATKSKGCYASFVIDHTMLLQKSINIPPMKQRDLNIFIKRKVDQFKQFEGNAAYGYTKSAIKKRLFVSVYYMPESVVINLKQACLDAGLYLIQIMPFAMIRAQQFAEMEIDDDEMAAMVVRMFDKVSLIIGKKDGTIFSERSLKADVEDDEDLERVVREVKRSILFNKQQFNQNIAMVKFSKRFNESFFETLENNLDIPVDWLPASKRFFWVKIVLSVNFNDHANLLMRKLRHDTAIRKHTKLGVVIAATLWICAIASAVGIEHALKNKLDSLSSIRERSAQQDRDEKKWKIRAHELNLLQSAVKELNENRTPPISGWFLGYLCNEMPEGLILKRMEIRRVENKWEVVMDGMSISGYKAMADELRLLSERLQNGPFHMQVNIEWYKNWLQQLKKGVIGSDEQNTFSISGVFYGT